MKLLNFSALKLLILFFSIPLIVQGDDFKWSPVQCTKFELKQGGKVVASATTDQRGNCTFKGIPLEEGKLYRICIVSTSRKAKNKKWTGRERLRSVLSVIKKDERKTETIIKNNSVKGAEIIKPLLAGMNPTINKFQLNRRRIQKTRKLQIKNTRQVFNIKMCIYGGPYSQSFSNLDDNG